jgi:Domain of unknown function (DUF1707)
VTSGTHGSPWSRFEHDPRDPAYSGMRASDRDRAVVHDVLAEAYAEGRLDREELDERTGAVDSAKTYADLLPPIRDLTADHAPARPAPVATTDLRRSAEQYYRDKLRDSFFGLLIPNLICWTIWYITGHGAFIWPIFVTIPTLINFLQVASNKRRTVESRIEKLQRREAKALEESSTSSAAESDSKELGTETDQSGPILDPSRERQARQEARDAEREQRHARRHDHHD